MALVEIVPDGVCGRVEHMEVDLPFVDAEIEQLQTAVDRRRREFIAGRHCLREALFASGAEGPITLLSDGDGLPEIPMGYLGSISHSRGLCLAVVATGPEFIYLGVDVEKTNRIGSAAMERVVHPDEAAWVNGDQRKASLLFSAKEAFYKAQFARDRVNGNFHDLVLEADESVQTLRVQCIAERFTKDLREAKDLVRLCFRYVGDYVLCLCWMKKS